MAALAESSKCYKHSLLSYLALAGDTEELGKYHAKLLDVIDKAGDGRPNDAAHELGALSVKLAATLGHHVADLVGVVADTAGGDAVVIRTKLMAQIEQVSYAMSNGLCPCQGQAMVIGSINRALVALSAINNIKYPDLDKLKP